MPNLISKLFSSDDNMWLIIGAGLGIAFVYMMVKKGVLAMLHYSERLRNGTNE